jgi:hypothetical protein
MSSNRHESDVNLARIPRTLLGPQETLQLLAVAPVHHTYDCPSPALVRDVFYLFIGDQETGSIHATRTALYRSV